MHWVRNAFIFNKKYEKKNILQDIDLNERLNSCLSLVVLGCTKRNLSEHLSFENIIVRIFHCFFKYLGTFNCYLVKIRLFKQSQS